MNGLSNLLLVTLIASHFCVSFQLVSSNQKANSNDLRQQLEDHEDNSSHHTLEDTNASQIIETIRSVDLFKAKVSKRIATSSVILHFPGMKTKLLEIAVEKFKSCEISKGSNEIQDVEHSCLGTATAQMMSLINNFEKNPSMHF